MKNYFNAEERTRHIVLMAMKEIVQKFSESESLSNDEFKNLKKIPALIDKVSDSIFERMGTPYRRKIISTLEVNNLKLVGKYSVSQECISHSATEDLEKKLADLRMFNCMDCENNDYKNCAMYAMCIACDIDADGNGIDCPYRM